MGRADIERGSARRPLASGASLLVSLLALAFGVRIAASIARTTLGRCVLEGSCDGLVGAVLSRPGPTVLGLVVIGASSAPLVLWIQRARGNAQYVAELSDLARKAVGTFSAALAVIIGTLFALEITARWLLSVSVALWMLGFAIITVSFRGDRRAQVLYVLAVLGFPVLMAWLLNAPVL